MASIAAVFGGMGHDHPRGEECSERCGWVRFVATAEFEPEPQATLRERVLLARMAAMYRAREIADGRG